jgi:hypothetical protein
VKVGYPSSCVAQTLAYTQSQPALRGRPTPTSFSRYTALRPTSGLTVDFGHVGGAADLRTGAPTRALVHQVASFSVFPAPLKEPKTAPGLFKNLNAATSRVKLRTPETRKWRLELLRYEKATRTWCDQSGPI